MESNGYDVKSKAVGSADFESSHGLRMLSVGARLQAERKRLGLTQQDVANHAFIHRQTQVNYEKDKRVPPIDYLDAISQLGIDSTYVMTGLRKGESLDLSIAKTALLNNLLLALGYENPDSQIAQALEIWTRPSPAQQAGGLEGFSGRLVGESPVVQLIRDSSANLDADLLSEALSTAEEMLAKGPSETAEKRAILACTLYRSAKQSGSIDRKLAQTLAALAD